MIKENFKKWANRVICAATFLITYQPAYAVIKLENTAHLKGLLNIDNKCEERASLASSYALSHYDVKEIYKDPAEIERKPRDFTNAQKLISLMYHRIGEEPPKLSQKDPVRELSADDMLILFAHSQRPGTLQQKQKALCTNLVATLGSLGDEATDPLNPNLNPLLEIIPEAKELITSCRDLTKSPQSADFSHAGSSPATAEGCVAGGSPSVASSGVLAAVSDVSAVTARVEAGGGSAHGDSPYITAYDNKSFSFLKTDNINKLFKADAASKDPSKKEATRTKASGEYVYYRTKLQNNFKFLNLVFKTLDQPLTQRALGAVYIKEAKKNDADIKEDGVANWVSVMSDSCLSAEGKKVKSGILSTIAGRALSRDESDAISRFQTAEYAVPATKAEIDGLADFGERLYATEKFAVSNAPAPRRIIYRSYDQSKPPKSIINYADCAETGIYNLVQTVFAKPGNAEFDLEALAEKAPKIHAEIQKHPTIPDQEEYSGKMRSGWNTLISTEASSLAHVVANGTEAGKKYEVQANISNFFHMIKGLFPGCSELEDVDAIHTEGMPKAIDAAAWRARKDRITSNLAKLSTCLSTAARPIQISAEHDSDWDGEFKSENVGLTIKVGNKKAIKMDLNEFMTPNETGGWQRAGHFALDDNVPIDSFWGFEKK